MSDETATLDEAPEIEPADAPETPDEEIVTADAEAEAPAPADDVPEDAHEETADPASPEIADPPSVDPEPEPFGFKADGMQVDVEGARVVGDEIRMTRESWNRIVQPHLANRSQWHTQQQAWKREREELTNARSEKEMRAEALLSRVDALLSDPTKLVEFVANYEQNAKHLQLEVENELLKSQRDRLSKGDTERREVEERDRFNEAAKPYLRQGIDAVLAEDEFKGVGLDAEKMQARMWALHERGMPVFFQAKAGDGSGLEPGQWGVDLSLIRDTLEPAKEAAQRVREQSAKQQKAQQVRASNAAATGQAPKKVPPAASARAGGTPSTERAFPKTAEEYQEWKARRSREVGLPL